MPTYGGDEVSAVVLDIGTSTTRAGYAGEDCPKCVIPTSYGLVPGASDTDQPTYYFGDHGPSAWRPNQSILSPLADGIIQDWDVAERLIKHAFSQEMRLGEAAANTTTTANVVEGRGGVLSDYPLLVTEPSWNSKENRERMIELAFEEFATPAYYSVDRAVCNAFAAGKGTALVVDLGEAVTSVTPVFDGWVLRKAIQKSPLSGSLLTQLATMTLRSDPTLQHASLDLLTPQWLISTRGNNDGALPTLKHDRIGSTHPTMIKYGQDKIVHEIKENVMEFWPKVWDEMAVNQIPTKPFDFPVGISRQFGRLRFSIPEYFMNPSHFPFPPSPSLHDTFTQFQHHLLQQQINSTIPTIPLSIHTPSLCKTILNSITCCDSDIQPTLLSNIILTGSGSLVPGLVDRLQQEIGSNVLSVKVKINAAGSVVERRFGSWLGGSILASLGTFHQLWIGKEEVGLVLCSSAKGNSLVARLVVHGARS